MTRAFILFAAAIAGLAALILALPTPDRTPSATPALAITDVTVFDGEAFLEAQTVLIEDGLIAALRADLPAPDGAQSLDGAGMTLLPGLIDAHTHTWGDGLQDALGFGVTTHLDMFSSPLQLPEARAARRDRSVHDRADLFSAGVLATVEGGHGTQFGLPVETLSGPEDAAAWVAARKREGSDYVKLVYIPGAPRLPSLDLATARAVIEAAHDEDLMALAHIDSLEGAREMVSAGIDGLVHVFADAPVDAHFVDAARAAEVFVIPTLAVLASAAGTGAGARLAQDGRVAERLGAAEMRSLQGGFGLPPSPRFQYPLAQANVRALHAGGVAILAGSDAPNPGTAYGASLHHELQLLVDAGLTPHDALRAATYAPAAAFDLAGRGRITPGARADLVLLAGDPRRGIDATLSIAAVIRNGVLHSAETGSDRGADPAGRTPATRDIGAFEAETNGFSWIETSDAMAGGASEAVSNVSGGVLRSEVTVRAGFPFPWAGPGYFPAAQDVAALDLAEHEILVLRVRGAPGAYRLMVFNPATLGAPPTVPVALDESWRTVRLDLTAVEGFDPAEFAGLALVAGPQPGEAWIEIAEARFEPAP